jgi:23S rRNA pseudouridine1911/1915/1917 synthase
MDIKIIYEDNDVLVVDKPAGMVVFPEGQTKNGTVIDALIEKYPELKNAGDQPRYGIVHRLDKDTSGVLLVAKNNKALIFLQKQFINKTTGVILSASLGNKNSDSNSLALLDNRTVEKKYVCLVEGIIKEDKGEIKTLIGRAPGDKRKQKAYPLNETSPGRREAITEYKVLERFKDYTLLEVEIKTGRRHQIRCHLSYLHHPIAGDKLYSFKNSPTPEGLTRQFLHAKQLKIQLPSGNVKEFNSELPEELQKVLNNLS